jgi:FkbM family methyltransferase
MLIRKIGTQLIKIDTKLNSIFVRSKKTSRISNNPYFIDCSTTISTFLKYSKPKIVYDIGANDGTWSKILLELNPHVKDISLFEPRKEAFNKIKENLSANINLHLFQFALGSENTVSVIKGGSTSASLLDAGELQNILFPGSFNSQCNENITINRLDDVVKENNLSYPDLIKIDVQGYEMEVLKSAENVLKNTPFLIIELSFVELYKNQPPTSQLLDYLERFNFRIIDFGYQWRNSQNQIIQIDTIFQKDI